ncbi:MAG: hypothetical protein FWC13_08180 [Oscillospiraceae bacterium]|nr:hypothetical protein [Oscillospiraceae bacterium]
MSNDAIIRELVSKIISIEQECVEPTDVESYEIRRRIVDAIIAELEKVVINNEN